ncbi:MAG TPA: hypothetical protein VF062_06135 [Candidatus Limnocylindrales bacterium]
MLISATNVTSRFVGRMGVVALAMAMLLGTYSTPSWADGGPGSKADPRAAVAEYHEVTANISLKLDAKAKTVVPVASGGTHRVRDARGRILRNEPISVSARPHEIGIQDDFKCVVSNINRPGLQVYQPWDLTRQGNSYFVQYLYHLYSIDNARYITGVGYTFQVETCTTGGGDVWNDHHQWFNGTTFRDQDSNRRMIGTAWGTAVVNGAVSSSLSFSVAQDPVSIGGSVNVQQQDNYAGNTGPNENMDPALGGWVVAPWNVNRVNSYYVSPHNFVWDGSQNFQGNTNQALYEYPMAGGPAGFWGAYDGAWTIGAFCSRIPGGTGCPAW